MGVLGGGQKVYVEKVYVLFPSLTNLKGEAGLRPPKLFVLGNLIINHLV